VFAKSKRLNDERHNGVRMSNENASITSSVSFVGPALAAGKKIKLSVPEIVY
jgi:hypothetical protein